MDAKAHKTKNRLYVTIDVSNLAEWEQWIDELDGESSKLERGFTCLTDIRLSGDLDGERFRLIRRAQEIMVKRGVSCVARVISSDAGLIQMKMDHISRMLGYHAIPVKNFYDAEYILDNWKVAPRE